MSRLLSRSEMTSLKFRTRLCVSVHRIPLRPRLRPTPQFRNWRKVPSQRVTRRAGRGAFVRTGKAATVCLEGAGQEDSGRGVADAASAAPVANRVGKVESLDQKGNSPVRFTFCPPKP